MKCFRCDHPVLEMVEIRNDVYECSLCDMIFDKDHANYTENELRENGHFNFSNSQLADQWYDYFRVSIFPDIKLIKHGYSQYLYINTKGKREVTNTFLDRKLRLLKDLETVNNILNDLDCKIG